MDLIDSTTLSAVWPSQSSGTENFTSFPEITVSTQSSRLFTSLRSFSAKNLTGRAGQAIFVGLFVYDFPEESRETQQLKNSSIPFMTGFPPQLYRATDRFYPG